MKTKPLLLLALLLLFGGIAFPAYGLRIKLSSIQIHVPLDTTSPGPARNFLAMASTFNVNLSWINPSDMDFLSVQIRRGTSTYPTSPVSNNNDVVASDVYGTLVTANCTSNVYSDNNLSSGTYYYSIFASDLRGNYSTVATASVIVDPRAPSGVTAAPWLRDVSLSWIKPIDSNFGTVIVKRSTSGYPVTNADGTSVGPRVYAGNGTYWSDKGLADGTYYYSIFARKNDGTYSPAAHVAATVHYLFSDETVESTIFIENHIPTPDAGEETRIVYIDFTASDNHVLTYPDENDGTSFYYRFSDLSHDVEADAMRVWPTYGKPETNPSFNFNDPFGASYQVTRIQINSYVWTDLRNQNGLSSGSNIYIAGIKSPAVNLTGDWLRWFGFPPTSTQALNGSLSPTTGSRDIITLTDSDPYPAGGSVHVMMDLTTNPAQQWYPAYYRYLQIIIYATPLETPLNAYFFTPH